MVRTTQPIEKRQPPASRRLLAATLLALVLATPLPSRQSGVAGAEASATTPGPQWVATWRAAQVEPAATGPSAIGFSDQTVRQIVHTSIGGSELRLQLSNVFGSTPVAVSAATVGVRQVGATVVDGTNRAVTVDRSASFVLPAGAVLDTDPVPLSTAPGADLA